MRNSRSLTFQPRGCRGSASSDPSGAISMMQHHSAAGISARSSPVPVVICSRVRVRG